MAYQTGVASSPLDLLDKVRLFCVANGATQVQWYQVMVSTLQENVLHLEFGGKQFLLMAHTPGVGAPTTRIHLRLFTGVGTGLGMDAYTLGGNRCYTRTMGSGPYTSYHFFKSGGTFFFVVEFAAGYYTMFSFGNVTKVGTYTGGEFVTVQCWAQTPPSGQENLPLSAYHCVPFDSITSLNSEQPINTGSGHIRCDFSGDATPRYRYFGYGITHAAAACGGMRGDFPTGFLAQSCSPNLMNFRSVLAPLPVFVKDVANVNTVPIGYVDGVAACDNLYITPGSVVDTDWRVFPWFARHVTAPASGGTSLTYAVALKMV